MITRRGLNQSFLAILICALTLAPSARINQVSFPAPPADRSLIYIADEANKLSPVAFESATTPLKLSGLAGSDKRSYVELKGEKSARVIANPLPRFYLFVPDQPNPHPPFIVLLTQKRGARRVTVLAQKGMEGFAVDSEAIVKPRYRVLAREGGMIYMEVSPRESLQPGEYAIIGSDLNRVATFSVSPA